VFFFKGNAQHRSPRVLLADRQGYKEKFRLRC